MPENRLPPLLIRPIRPEDGPRLADAMRRLSPESARRRFLTGKSRLSGPELRYLSEVDGVDHVALVAVTLDGDEELAGVGRFVRRPADDPETAEMAIVVGDELQGLGLGRELTQRLAEIGRMRGIRRFTATALADNGAARALLAGLGPVTVTGTGPVRDLCVTLGAPLRRAA